MKSISLKTFIICLFVSGFLLTVTSPLLYAKIVQDLANDTFSANAVKIDILSIDVESDSQYLYMTCTFASPVFETDTGDPFDLFGYIDLDVDQDATTGTTALSDFYNGSSEIGMDYYLELMPDAQPGIIALKNSNAKFIDDIPIVFNENSFIVTIPLNVLDNDDGFVNYTAFFGDAGGPDDVIPNSGFATNGTAPDPDPDPDPPAPSPSGGSGGGGGGCFISSVTNNSNNAPVFIVLLLSGLFLTGCVIIIKKF